ncbi:hypothetical protein BDN70DRAFT_806660 [Pholiota conissans]|uniref:MYND-type domain-containing protein n=1 Tax=Pholiota conissans TaxID=109636 RepID=A0A9P5Z578_9AGAR|nr:hypothetical protein BDN70DRAFT_806660 [Pholiota conissans]
MQLCGHCKAPCKRRCTLCESAYFCSPEHFRAEWPVHKLECYVKPPKDAMPSSGLHRGKVTGILFAEDADEPRMVQLNTLSGYTQKLQTWETINMHPYLPDNEKNSTRRCNNGSHVRNLLQEVFL